MTRNHFSEPVTFFLEKRLPEKASPAGYSALIDFYDLQAPLPRILFAIGKRHRIVREKEWHILTPRHAPHPSLEGHLVFALKYEGIDLAVLKRLFEATGPAPIEKVVESKPTGSYARRVWFLYEWLMGVELNLPDTKSGRYVPVVDPAVQLTVAGDVSSRHRVRNNLPGTPAFCPLVFYTNRLQKFMAMDLQKKAQEVIDEVSRDILARCAAFLLLKDSKASYAIEGEGSSRDRIQRWAKAIGEAGQRPLDEDELLRLHRIVIGDTRFVKPGLRDEGGFVGEHDRDSGLPIPVHISARPQELHELLKGMIAFESGPGRQLDPVVSAAVLAFGFVYTHPFEDGNGRIHRYLIHHVLAARGFNPPGVVFPVSAVILERIDAYRQVLEEYSSRLLPVVRWEATERGNVRVLHDTADFYRYFDATTHAEFLFECVQRTIEKDLPEETSFLCLYDEFRSRVEYIVDMPENTINLLFRFLRQNQGRLSRRARNKEFRKVTQEEAIRIESIYQELFG